MTFDIDVVADIARYMQREGSGLTPRLVVRRWDLGLAMPTDVEVSLDNLDALSAYERRLLVLESRGDGSPEGPSMTVNFQSRQPLRVDSQNVDQELVAVIIAHLRGTGTLRPAWPRIMPIFPPLFALLTAGLGIWALAASSANAPTVLFVVAVMLGLAAGSADAAYRLRVRGEQIVTGARFREASRAEVRERLRNARASAIVAIITTPIAGFIGYLLRLWTGG